MPMHFRWKRSSRPWCKGLAADCYPPLCRLLCAAQEKRLTMKTKFTIGTKLALGVAALIACLLVLSFTSLRVISQLSTSLDSAVNGTGKKLDLLAGTRE